MGGPVSPRKFPGFPGNFIDTIFLGWGERRVFEPSPGPKVGPNTLLSPHHQKKGGWIAGRCQVIARRGAGSGSPGPGGNGALAGEADPLLDLRPLLLRPLFGVGAFPDDLEGSTPPPGPEAAFEFSRRVSFGFRKIGTRPPCPPPLHSALRLAPHSGPSARPLPSPSNCPSPCP